MTPDRVASRTKIGPVPLPAAVRRFLATEAAGGMALVAAAAVALVWANSPWSAAYVDLWHTSVDFGAGPLSFDDDLRHLVNDGLLVLFFLVVGLEVKRELVAGELRDRRAAALPTVAAVGGMVVPAVAYLAVTAGTPGSSGWGVPMATDIAFALAVLALLGRRVPAALKLFLLTLAVVDDIGAIVVIAVAYSDDLDLVALAVAGALLAVAGACARRGITSPLVFVPLGVACWFATYRSGVHPTLAGVAFGLLAPVEVAQRIQDRLHPAVSFLVLPAFALANAGVEVGGGALEAPGAGRVAAGVVVGLVVGKVTGIVAAGSLAVRLRVAVLPDGVTWPQLASVAVLAGIGFTVSLFIGGLAFDDPALGRAATLAVLAASLVASTAGAALVAVTTRRSSRSSPRAVRAARSTPRNA
jgi:NhaA family Na+:H+ antiporter